MKLNRNFLNVHLFLVAISKRIPQANWYYYTATGEKLRGWQNVDGVTLYFDEEGRQAKNGERIIDGFHYYFSHYSGAVKTNYWDTWTVEIRRWEPFEKTYNVYYGSDGRRYYGWHRVGDQLYYFDHTGRVENALTTFKDKTTSLIIMENW